MAFDRTQLFCLSQVGDSSLWSYEGTDPPATVIAANFIPSGYGLQLGDIVVVKQFATSAKAALTALTINHVSAVSASGVTLTQTAT